MQCPLSFGSTKSLGRLSSSSFPSSVVGSLWIDLFISVLYLVLVYTSPWAGFSEALCSETGAVSLSLHLLSISGFSLYFLLSNFLYIHIHVCTYAQCIFLYYQESSTYIIFLNLYLCIFLVSFTQKSWSGHLFQPCVVVSELLHCLLATHSDFHL